MSLRYCCDKEDCVDLLRSCYVYWSVVTVDLHRVADYPTVHLARDCGNPGRDSNRGTVERLDVQHGEGLPVLAWFSRNSNKNSMYNAL
jgi:hypothetical protein